MCLFFLFMYAHGDMTGFGGTLLAIGWSTLYLALPAWVVLRVINYVLWGNSRAALRIDR